MHRRVVREFPKDDGRERFPQRQALILRYFADLSVRDTAAAMRCPENTVKTHTRRALEALRLSGLLDDEIELADEPDHDEEVG